MGEIIWTKEAERWLKDIHDFIALDKPIAAKKVVEGIYNKVQILKRLPESGYRYDKFPEFHIRILLFGHYRIAYLISDEGIVYILGIYHGALDIDKYIFRG